MATQAAREQAAADKVAALLPEEQGKAYRALWEEFDRAETDDAQFGIKPKTQAMAICTKILLVRIVVKISSVKKPIKRFITKVATKI